MQSTTATTKNLHVWAQFSPVAKRMTRKGKVIFTVVGSDVRYITDGKFCSCSQFDQIVADAQRPQENR
jgi:predicted nucleic acid-binding Zn finger protein